MELKLQSILFPDKEEYTDNADLFYKGGLGIRDAEEKCFVFSKYSTCDFGAYLNAFSMKKWKTHKICQIILFTPMADAPLIPAVTELMLLSSFIQIQEK